MPAQIGTEEVKKVIAAGAVALAIVLRMVVAGALLGLLPRWIPQGYVVRFDQIAASNGTPYRDFAVEYPPVSLAAIELIGADDPQGTGARLIWLALAADAAVAVALLRGWGRRAAGAYLIGSIPVLGPDLRLRSMYLTLDILPVALSTVGMALALRRRERAGGVVLAAAVLAKIWPLVLAPAFFVWGRRRALVWFGLALAVGTALWVLWAGVGGIGQVSTQRHASGWQVESTVGTSIWIFGDETVRIIKDSQRIGTAPVWATSLMTAVGALGVVLVWLRARRTPDEVGAACLASVALLLFVAPIYSYPFVLWLLPWSAMALAEGRDRLSYLGFGVVALTAFIYATLGGQLVREASPAIQFVLLLRNGVTGAIPVAYLFSRRVAARVDEHEGLPRLSDPPYRASWRTILHNDERRGATSNGPGRTERRGAQPGHDAPPVAEAP